MEVEASLVWNTFKSQAHKVELSCDKVVDIKCSRDSEVTVMIKIDVEGRLARCQGWQIVDNTI